MSQQFARIPTDAARSAVLGACRGARLFSYLRPHWRPFAIALVGLVVSSAVGLAFPLIIAGITTEVVAGGDSGGLDQLIVMLVALFLLQAAGGFLQTYLLGVVGERVVAQIRGELFGRLITLSLDFHTSHRVGELISRLSNDVTLVRTMLTQSVTSLLSSLIGLVGSVIILFTLSPSLLLVILLLAPALIAVAIVFGRPLQRVSTQVQDTIAGSTTTAEEALSGIRVVKSYVREDWELERYDRDLRTVVATGSRLALWRATFGMLMGFLGFGAIAALLWYTGHQVIDGTLGIGTLTGFLLYGVAIGASLGSLASLYGQFREGTGAIERVFEIIDTRPTILDAPDAKPLERVAGRIELDRVSFTPAVLVVLLSGLWLVLAGSEWNLGQLWVLLALGAFAAAFLVGALYLSRVALRLERAAIATPDQAAARAAIGQWLVGYGLVLAILVFALWDMVLKPGL